MNIEIEKERKVYLSALNANEGVALPASMFGGWLLAKSVIDRQLMVALDALRFYAEGHHFALADPDAWDTVSGEPQNFQCDEAGTATVEDGTMAKMALQELAGENTAYSDMIAADEEDMQAAIGATPPIPVGLFESAAQAVSDGRHEDAGNFLSTAIRLTAPAPQLGPFQQRIKPWMLECFGAEIAADRKERNHRFFEEATELVQACEMTRSEAHQLVDYVYGRPVGDAPQEVGAVMVTLAALCLANDFDMHAAGEVELARIWTKIEQIRAKQAAKPRHSPLPAAPQQKPVAWIDECDQMVVLEKFYKKHIGYVSEGRAIPDSWKPLCTAAPPPAPPVLSDEVTTYLQPRDMAALQRFFECCDDPDSGGHDVPKEAMARLREIGVVAYKPFGQHEITSFGDFVLGHTNGADFKFPLKTYAEYCEESKARAGYSNAADALLAKVRP